MEKALLLTKYELDHRDRARVIELNLDQKTIDWIKRYFNQAILRTDVSLYVMDMFFDPIGAKDISERFCLKNVIVSKNYLDVPGVRKVFGKIDIKEDWMPDFRADELPWRI